MNICYEDALSLVKYSGIKYVKVGRLYRVEYNEFEKIISTGNISLDSNIN